MDDRVSLHKLDLLVAIVDEGSVTAAARALHVSQPAVTGHLRALERQLGATLFARAGRGIEPTPAGLVAVAWAREVLALSRRVERDLAALREPRTTTITVAATTAAATAILPEVVVGFRNRRPDAVIRLLSLAVDAVVTAVGDGTADVGVASYLTPVPGGAVDVDWLGDEDLVLVTAPGRDGPPITLDELAELPFVCTPDGTARRHAIDEQLRAVGVGGRRIVLEMAHSEPIMDAVRKGAGVALLARSTVAADLAAGRLTEAPVLGVQLVHRVHLVRRRGAPPSASVLELIGGIRAAYRTRHELDAGR